MKSLTREEYLKEFKKKAKAICASKESALAFYAKIGVLNPDGTIHTNYTANDKLPVRPN